MLAAGGGFWTPEPLLYHTQSTGFALFGIAHLCLIALSLALVGSVTTLYLKPPKSKGDAPIDARAKMLRAVAGIPVALIALKCATYLTLGMFEPLFWPLHLCNLCEFVALGYALTPQSSVGKRFADLLFCWGLTGCPSALLFPGWSYYCPALCFASLCGFVEHALVFACALCMAVGGVYAPHPSRVWFVLLVTVTCGAVFRLLNPLLGTNFFFVTNPAGAGGFFPWLARTFGDPGFLAPYLLLAVASWGLLYGIYRIAGSRH